MDSRTCAQEWSFAESSLVRHSFLHQDHHMMDLYEKTVYNSIRDYSRAAIIAEARREG